MGEVYEADDLETGRRIALKILSQRLDSPDARRRFLNEGRLAANINHPNSVYVFGAEEVAGVPVISMELMPGGTLLDKVCSEGALPCAEAVDIALQIIDGLAAAHTAGILHRDIKPSNCFIDEDGTVKLGDYGLSISTKGHERPPAGEETFMGTPTFASPEQLRGDDLTVRSDIYSLGATIFTLLAGDPPFLSKDTIRLLAKVLENPAPNLTELRQDIPKGLAEAVRRCLAKRPDDRFADCAELRAAIAGFGTHGRRAAEPWRRLAAGAVDIAIIGVPPMAVRQIPAIAGISGFAGFVVDLAAVIATALLAILYFTLLEWKLGKTTGKTLLGLEVRGASSAVSDWPRVLGRTCLFVVLPAMATFTVFPPLDYSFGERISVSPTLFGREFEGTYVSRNYTSAIGLTTLAGWGGAVLLLFAGASRRNGWSGLHDYLSSTRVVAFRRPVPRAARIADGDWIPMADDRMIGPFHVFESMEGAEGWFVGYDPSLLKKVWLREVPPGTPPVPTPLRNLRRATRLRWLAGSRSEERNWDAYEFPGGSALLSLTRDEIAWRTLLNWMRDLAAELSASAGEGTRSGSPGADEVWIAAEGRAKLLDFTAPGVAMPEKFSGLNFWQDLASRVSDKTPLPLPVRDFIASLGERKSPAAILLELDFLADVPAEVSPARRLGIIAAGAAMPTLVGMCLFLLKDKSLSVTLAWSLAVLIACVALPALFVPAVAGRGLILHAMGVTVVDGKGHPAGAALLAQRSLIAWLPTLTCPAFYGGLLLWHEPGMAGVMTLAVLALLAAASALFPGRSLHDRLAGTWLVPR